MTAVDVITTQAVAANAGRWPEFAAAFRQAQAAFASLEESADDVAAEAAHDAFAPLYAELLAYPVHTHVQLAEKAALINLDCWNKAAAFDALSADLARLSASRVRTAWIAAVEAYKASGAAFYATRDDGDQPGGALLWEAHKAAWRDLVDTAAPDPEATAYKIAAYIDLAHTDEPGDAANNSDTLQRLLNETEIDGAFGVVRLLRDACLQAGIAHPITTMAADT